GRALPIHAPRWISRSKYIHFSHICRAKSSDQRCLGTSMQGKSTVWTPENRDDSGQIPGRTKRLHHPVPNPHTWNRVPEIRSPVDCCAIPSSPWSLYPGSARLVRNVL